MTEFLAQGKAVLSTQTAQFRWSVCDGDDPLGFHRAWGGGTFKLQQLWRGDDGSEEWIDVPINFGEAK